MSYRKIGYCLSVHICERPRNYDERLRLGRFRLSEYFVQAISRRHLDKREGYPQAARRLLQRRHGETYVRITAGSEHSYSRYPWKDLFENLKPFRVSFMGRFKGYASHIAARARETRYQSELHRKRNRHENYWHILSQFFCHHSADGAPDNQQINVG